MARGETIRRAATAGTASKRPPSGRQQRKPGQPGAPDDRPGIIASLAIAIGFALALLVFLGGLAIFGMLLTAPGDGNGKAWSAAITNIVHSLLVGWTFSTVVSLGLSMARRPIAGMLIGVGSGAAAAFIAARLFL